MTELGYVLKNIDVQLGHFDGFSGELADTEMIKTMCEKQLNEHPVWPKVEENPGLVEGNAYWVRNDAIDVEFPDFETVYSFNQSYFSEEDYVTCDVWEVKFLVSRALTWHDQFVTVWLIVVKVLCHLCVHMFLV